MAIALCVSVLTAGCGALGKQTIRADAGAVREVYEIGRTVGQTFEDPIYGNVVQIDDILVMDVGADSFKEGMGLASDRLKRLGWALESEGDWLTTMASTRWKDVYLTVRPFETGDKPGLELQNRAAEQLKLTPPDRGKYVVVTVSRAPS
ncbi:hypothetical protein [Nonomuraea endophytica]|uniref:Uncharacterized protein n=1 Tax=Nonomuraea endophytica TaxID=714136 RepID=A0A7W8EID5_9ACTN|nr:hypothetical protein [Nonomuraea endophytica]MBB5081895.1 hypothetical protein [Nonomuraea endophytica]